MGKRTCLWFSNLKKELDWDCGKPERGSSQLRPVGLKCERDILRSKDVHNLVYSVLDGLHDVGFFGVSARFVIFFFYRGGVHVFCYQVNFRDSKDLEEPL